jgi:hypothetical protein
MSAVPTLARHIRSADVLGMSVKGLGFNTAKVARRKLANKLVGILHGCLTHQTMYDEHLAWHRPAERLAA